MITNSKLKTNKKCNQSWLNQVRPKVLNIFAKLFLNTCNSGLGQILNTSNECSHEDGW